MFTLQLGLVLVFFLPILINKANTKFQHFDFEEIGKYWANLGNQNLWSITNNRKPSLAINRKGIDPKSIHYILQRAASIKLA